LSEDWGDQLDLEVAFDLANELFLFLVMRRYKYLPSLHDVSLFNSRERLKEFRDFQIVL